MRIDAYNSINQLYKVNAVKKTGKVTSATQTDSFTISQEAKDFQVAMAAVKESADVRTDVVNDLKSRIDAGSYEVTSSDFADKLIARYFG